MPRGRGGVREGAPGASSDSLFAFLGVVSALSLFKFFLIQKVVATICFSLLSRIFRSTFSFQGSISHPEAGPTSTGFFGLDRVFFAYRMSARENAPTCQPAPNVLTVGYWFEVSRINATRIAAKVVQVKFPRNRTYENRVDGSVRVHGGSPPVIGSARDYAVSVLLNRAFPMPATCRLGGPSKAFASYYDHVQIMPVRYA